MSRSLALGFLLLVLFFPPVTAAEILWSAHVNQEITDLAMPEDGSRIVLAAEWVHLFSRDGTLSWKQWNARRIAISLDGRYIAAGTSLSIDLVDRTGRKLWSREIEGDLSAFAMSADGSRIVAGTSEGSLFFYDNSGELLNETVAGWRAPYPPVQDLSIAANGRYTAVVSSRAVYLYNYTGHLLWEELNSTFLDGRFVAINARGRELAVAGTYELYYLHSGGEELWVYRPNSPISVLAISSDESTIALGTQDNRVILIDREGGEKGTFTGSARVASIALSENGSLVLVGLWDGTLALLDANATLLDSRKLLDRVNIVAFSADRMFGAAATRTDLYALSFILEPTPPTTALTTAPAISPTTTSLVIPTDTTISGTTPTTALPEMTPSSPPTTSPTTPGLALIPLLAIVFLILWRR